MNAIDCIERLSKTSIISAPLKFCLVDSSKHPYKLDGTPARPNTIEDFESFENLVNAENLDKYNGVGISIQASNICAIDVDHCFSKPNDITSADDRANDILELFRDIAYCEFSFSGTGLRILFDSPVIENYSDKYYIKNEKYGVEYYQPSKSFRYVTLTGNCISDNYMSSSDILRKHLEMFLNKYMIRTFTNHAVNTAETETRTFDELMKLVRKHYLKDVSFQNLWFTNAPGSGKDESERDYHLVAYLYENITQDKNLIKQIFEQSNFFKTKDSKHIYKWTNQNGRYFDYVYNMIVRTH